MHPSVIFVFLRKFFITIWFWLWVCIATALTGIFATVIVLLKYITESQGLYTVPYDTHDLITINIEGMMTWIIYYAMTLPRFWKMETYNEKNFNLEELEKGQFILASNHSSIIDTLFMSMMPCRKTYTYNTKWSMVPVFGWLCVWAGYIGIDTKSEASRKSVVGQVADRVRRGYSVMIYPEGTRTRNPYIIAETIKSGAFRISQETKVPVLPIVFNNTFQAVDHYGIADIANIDIIITHPLEIKEDLHEYKGDFLRAIRRHLQKEVKVD